MDILILRQEDVQNLLDPDSLLDALAGGFKSLSEGKVVAPRRNELNIAEAGFVLGMPAWQPQNDAAIKLVSVFHSNHQVGLPAHQALICLFDAQTGTPISIMDGTSITAMRTAGAAALSTRLLARGDASVLAILGAGVQGNAHLQLLPRVRDFRDIRIASRDFSHAQQLAATHSLARPVESFEGAVRGADVICLCSSSNTPIISADWLSPGAHVTSVGYAPPGGELERGVIARGRIFVETRLAFEPPPVGCSELAGLDPKTGAELGEVLLGQRPGRQFDQDITVYKAMGHAMEDMIAANLVYQRAREQGIGQRVGL
ncbi:MAG TPA: ornithine cyclodeaminase family protein [Ktedonobacteraceae bacterium]|nr:ornithine cyclodeaminase family protein [Ktedonobacteraceae bacterium]